MTDPSLWTYWYQLEGSGMGLEWVSAKKGCLVTCQWFVHRGRVQKPAGNLARGQLLDWWTKLCRVNLGQEFLPKKRKKSNWTIIQNFEVGSNFHRQYRQLFFSVQSSNGAPHRPPVMHIPTEYRELWNQYFSVKSELVMSYEAPYWCDPGKNWCRRFTFFHSFNGRPVMTFRHIKMYCIVTYCD